MTEFKALDDEICLLPDKIDSELVKTFKEDFPDDLPIVLLKKERLEIFFENMYDIKDIETYNICANVASFLLINDYYPYHYLNGITSREGLNESSYQIPDYIFTLDLNEIIEADDLQFIIIKNIIDEPRTLWNVASAYGQLNIIKWLHENRIEGSFESIDYAAEDGHLNVIKWLHENRNDGCSTDAMDYAALNGHLNVVIWLHENRDEGCTTKAVFFAKSNGYLDVVKWLNENRTEGGYLI